MSLASQDPVLPPTTDGLVLIRAPEPGDARLLIAGRDEEFRRFLGPGSDQPAPAGCIHVAGLVVGWVDYDLDRAWLLPGEVNVGYHLFAPHRGNGIATRAVRLLLHHLAVRTGHRTATLLIDPANERSVALAARIGASRCAHPDGAYFKRPVPPLSYTDGTLTIRRFRLSDLEADLAAKDEEQIRWLWLPGQREAWEAMSPARQRAHAAADLRERIEVFGAGPKWTFAADTGRDQYVVYIDCDLANERVPAGQASISYSCHPAHRGKGYVSRAVRLIIRFLRDHTGAQQAHILVDEENVASLRVARAVGATPHGSSDEHEPPLARHIVVIDRQS